MYSWAISTRSPRSWWSRAWAFASCSPTTRSPPCTPSKRRGRGRSCTKSTRTRPRASCVGPTGPSSWDSWTLRTGSSSRYIYKNGSFYTKPFLSTGYKLISSCHIHKLNLLLTSGGEALHLVRLLLWHHLLFRHCQRLGAKLQEQAVRVETLWSNSTILVPPLPILQRPKCCGYVTTKMLGERLFSYLHHCRTVHTYNTTCLRLLSMTCTFYVCVRVAWVKVVVWVSVESSFRIFLQYVHIARCKFVAHLGCRAKKELWNYLWVEMSNVRPVSRTRVLFKMSQPTKEGTNHAMRLIPSPHYYYPHIHSPCL